MTPTSSRLRLILGWLPFALLADSAAAGWWFFLRGGMHSVYAWLALLSAVPLLALLVALGTIVRTAWTRRKLGRLAATIALAGFCLWPAAWGFGRAMLARVRVDATGVRAMLACIPVGATGVRATLARIPIGATGVRVTLARIPVGATGRLRRHALRALPAAEALRSTGADERDQPRRPAPL